MRTQRRTARSTFFSSTWGKRRKRSRYVRRGISNRLRAISFWSGVRLDLKSLSIRSTAWIRARLDLMSGWYPSRTPRYRLDLAQLDHLNQVITKMEGLRISNQAPSVQYSGHDAAFLVVKFDTSPVGESLTDPKLRL